MDRMRIASAALVIALAASPAVAQECHGGASFAQWLDGVRQEAAASGISQGAIAALDGVRFSQDIVNRDRRQGVFSQSFLEFSDRMVNSYRLEQGANRLRRHADLFAQVERQYGVPGPVITAFWALETDFGANTGDVAILPALATLAYDCRRPDEFRPQLLDALRIIDRGDLTAGQMVGAWAGELGQTQFQPSDYLARGVDADGDGHVNLIKSAPDVIASTAALLAYHGWQGGQPWLEEVTVPEQLPWDQADLYIQHPRAQWAEWGVTKRDGSPVAADRLPASLLLPMGRHGPAFLAYPNFQVYLKWNQSAVYATTAAYLATRLAGAPRVSRGRNEVAALSRDQIHELQELLAARGYDVGRIDGIIGARTREAVRDMQVKLGLPADSYPTPEFLRALRRAN
jgi:lytic murein transglycosylase